MPDEPERPEYRIQVLEALDAVRLRPAMYLGPLDRPSLAADIAAEAARFAAHRAPRGSVVIRLDSAGRVTVEDTGRGLPSEPTDGSPGEDLQTVFLRFSHRRDDAIPFCLGTVVINAVSSRFVVENWADGTASRIVCERGRQLGDVERIGLGAADGLRVTYVLDRGLLGHPRLRFDHLLGRLRDASAEVPGVTFSVEDARRVPVRRATLRAGAVE